MKCNHCQEEVSVFKKICPHCGQETGSKVMQIKDKTVHVFMKIARMIKKVFFYLYQRAIFYMKKAWPHIKKFFSVKKHVYWTSGALAFLILFFVILGFIRRGESEPPLMSLSQSELETVQNVSELGGTITVDDETSSIYGFEISIPSGAVNEEISFEITTQEITSHELGDTFEPITPLIHIDNGSVFTEEPMILEIPIDIDEDEFAMGFYYDEEKNKLEGIPLKDVTTTSITLLTNHFSSIVVSKIKIDDLLKLSGAVDQYVDTGFTPGVDDWQFTNYGSYLAQNGHCAGQVLTMSWYYHTQKMENEEPALYDLFDNVGSDKTPNFYEDDQLGYRFASVIQYLLDFESREFYDYLDFAYGKESLIYYAFSYAMVVTKAPQLMAIYALDDFGNIISGHAILAYKMRGYDIYVADPNYPGQTDRKVHFNTSPGVYKFDPYSSGANAQAIINDGALLYDEMYYIGESALIDYESIEDAYDKVLDGTIGDLYFPTLEALYLDEYNEDVNLQSWIDIEDGMFELGTTHNEKMSCSLQNTVVMAFTVNHPNAVFTLYEGTEVIDGPYLAGPDGYVYFEVDITNGMNEIGVYAEIEEQGNRYYADFMRVKVGYQAGTTIPCEATIVGTYHFESRSDGKILVNNHKIEIRSDGTYTESYYLNESSYHNVSSGTWVVEPGQNAGENILFLTAQSVTTTYEVLDNYQTLRYTSDDIVFIFKK